MPNPIDEMTEEQKEYEAMKLVNMLDKLSRYCIPIHFFAWFLKMFYFFVSLTESYHRTATLEIHVDWNRVAQAAVVQISLGYHGFSTCAAFGCAFLNI